VGRLSEGVLALYGYRVTERRGGGHLITITGRESGADPWMLTSTAVRQDQPCYMCGKVVGRGLAPMYRPITNRGHRGHRICVECVEGTNGRDQAQDPDPDDGIR
jgi:hypothetical protein